jgi:5-methylcytosine-specific restriction endonuclease McrA
MTELRTCITCNEARQSDSFYRYAYTTTAGNPGHRYDSRCKPCARARRIGDYSRNTEARKAVAREWKASQGEAALQKVRDYRVANREKWLLQKRAYEAKRRSGGSLDSAAAVRLVRRVLDEARVPGGYLDAYTGEIINDPEVDHIVPLARGGAHEYDNLCVTSGFNNRSKRDTPMLVWMARRAAA